MMTQITRKYQRSNIMEIRNHLFKFKKKKKEFRVQNECYSHSAKQTTAVLNFNNNNIRCTTPVLIYYITLGRDLLTNKISSSLFIRMF